MQPRADRIIKDKLFWFAGFEGLRVTQGSVVVDTIPSDIAGPGTSNSMVDACNASNPNHVALGAAGNKINALSAQLTGLNPVTCVVTPASSTVENLFPYNPNASTSFAPGLSSTGPLNSGVIKGDYAPGPHHHLSGMYYKSKTSQVSAGSALLPQWVGDITADVEMSDGAWTWTPNSVWVNDVRLGLSYFVAETLSADSNELASNPWPNGYSINTGVTTPLYGGMPLIKLGFTGSIGGGVRTSSRGPEGDASLVETVSYLHGKHAFKFGFDYVDVVLDGDTYSQAQGDVVFTNLTNFLQGIPSTGTILRGDPTEQARSHWYGTYFQDDWRLTNKVTLNLGLRYEYIAAPVVRNNYLGNFNPNVNPATTPAIQQFGPGAPLSSEYNAEKKDISPRLGVAWDVQGNGRTVVRAGAGMFRDPSILKSLLETVPFGANFPTVGTGIEQQRHINQCSHRRSAEPGGLRSAGVRGGPAQLDDSRPNFSDQCLPNHHWGYARCGRTCLARYALIMTYGGSTPNFLGILIQFSGTWTSNAPLPTK